MQLVRLSARLIQIAIIGAIVWTLSAPPSILVTLGPQETVQTVHPKVGVHTRLTDEPEEWKIQKSLQLVRELGASWIVEYFPWAYIENQQGQFDWTHADLVVEHARRQGLTVVARLGFVPNWARPTGSPISYLGSDHYVDFANFVGAFAEHYRGRVDYLVIWNEPNTNFEWGEQPVDPTGYVQLLKLAYASAKAKNPQAKILAGALAPNLSPAGATDTMNDLEYLDKMYAAGARDYFDLLAVHAYGWTAPEDQPPSPGAINFRRTELLRQVMVKNGDASKHIIITEGGWNDAPRWTKAVTPPERIEYTLSAYNWCETTSWVDACAMWAFRFPAPTFTYNDYWTFVTPEFDLKPIYLEVRKYTEGQ